MLLFEVVLPMINQVYQLVAPRQFEVTYNNVDIYSDYVIVRPLYMSICAADQRYYTGSRDENVLSQKLPMSLIHEGVGEVVFDSKGVFNKGTKVVMVRIRRQKKTMSLLKTI